MTVFPVSCPVSLVYRPGKRPIKTFRSISGATRTRVYGSLPVDASLSAEFRCTTELAGLIIDTYYSTSTGASPVTFPLDFFTGHEEIETRIPDYLSWYILEEPTITMVMKGRTQVTVEFQGRFSL